MSISQLRKQFTDIPGASGLTMRYENGGDIQVFCIGDKEARVPAPASAAEIRAAIIEALR